LRVVKGMREVKKKSLCDKCLRPCKQPVGTLLLDCPRFLKRPFKIAAYRFEQLELFVAEKKGRERKKK
jgi:hypothetical protein